MKNRAYFMVAAAIMCLALSVMAETLKECYDDCKAKHGEGTAKYVTCCTNCEIKLG